MRLPDALQFQRLLAPQYGDARAAQIVQRVQVRYDELCAQHSRETNRALRTHIERIIFPGLALYQALLTNLSFRAEREISVASKRDFSSQKSLLEITPEWTISHAEAFVRVQEIEAELVRGRQVVAVKMLKHIPRPFWLFRLTLRLQMQTMFPAHGWQMQWIEDSPRRVAFNMTRCFYLDTLTRYGAPELTPAFCNTDDVLGEMLAPMVRFKRAGTLARGNAVCDFSYELGTK